MEDSLTLLPVEDPPNTWRPLTPLLEEDPIPLPFWQRTPSWRPPSLSPLCLQRLAAIQQVLNAQKISFLLRGGVRVLVALRDTGTGEPLGAPLQNR